VGNFMLLMLLIKTQECGSMNTEEKKLLRYRCYHYLISAFQYYMFDGYRALLWFNWFQVNSSVYGHFGPKTLRTQDISALVTKCLVDTLAPAKKFETLRHCAETLRHCISGAEVS